MSNKPYRSLAMITLGLLVVFVLLQVGYLAAGYNDLQGDEPLPPAVWTCWNVGTADPCQQDIRAVAMLSTTDGWAVGQNGLAMRWNGLNWTAHDTPTQGWLNDVTAVAPDNVWAVGGLTTDDPFEPETIIIHWNGNTWQEWPVPPDAIEGHLTVVAMHSANYGLAAGSSGVLEWNGMEWEQLAKGCTRL